MRSVPIEIKGKIRNIRYDYNAICDLEEISGKSIDKLEGVSSLRYMLWAGAKWETKGLTLSMTGIWINDYLQEGGTFEELLEVCKKAIAESGLFGNTEGK